MTYTRCRIDTINSPDDGHMAARNIQRTEIKVHEKELCVRLVIYKDYTEMHGQQNIKFSDTKQAKLTYQYKNIKKKFTRIMQLSGIIKLAFRL